MLSSSPRADVVTSVQRVLDLTVFIEGDGVYGAGFLVDPAHGVVLTNWHVVDEMHTPRVTAFGGKIGSGKVIAHDEKEDLALVAVPALARKDVVAPRLADVHTLRPGQEVYAIGTPRKLPFTVSRGIVSFVGREMDGESYLQVDMDINDGNSGGPVFTADGDIVGVMSFILRNAQALSFALPVTDAVKAFPSAFPHTR
jgi:S1-C subfamily serine protease